MGDKFEEDALLEEQYKGDGEQKNRKSSRSPEQKSRDRRSRSQSRDRHRRKSRSRSRERKRDSRRRSRSYDRHRDRKRSRSPERRRRSRSHERRRRDSRSPRRRSPSPRRRSRSPIHRSRSPRQRSSSPKRHSPHKERSPHGPLTPEERDARTVFLMQLSQRCRARDIEDFFSSVGKISDVRLIMCNKTRRFKGIAYVEFKEIESVSLALGLNGQKLLGIPVLVQQSQAEKNRVSQTMDRFAGSEKGPMKLYIGSLHFNITEDMLRGIFEPFGSIQSIQLAIDQDTGRSRGYGFVTFHESEDAKKALEQMNGFELAGRPIKVNIVTDKIDHNIGNGMGLDIDEMDRSGVDLGATGRLALMAKLAAGTGMKLPEIATQALNHSGVVSGIGKLTSVASAATASHIMAHQQQQQLVSMNPPIATQCFMLSNMFDPASETQPAWDLEIRDDVIMECNKHGGVCHIYVDKMSQGNVYVKCPNIAVAVASVNALHGRWFAGKVITAAYVPLVNYHNLYPDAISALVPLAASR